MIELDGVRDIALLCGVRQSAVSNWVARHPDTIPEPVKTGRNVKNPVLGWFPKQRGAWLLFASGLRDGTVR